MKEEKRKQDAAIRNIRVRFQAQNGSSATVELQIPRISLTHGKLGDYNCTGRTNKRQENDLVGFAVSVEVFFLFGPLSERRGVAASGHEFGFFPRFVDSFVDAVVKSQKRSPQIHKAGRYDINES